MIREIYKPAMEGVAALPVGEVFGSDTFETAYLALMDSFPFDRTVVGRGIMPPVISKIEFVESAKPGRNKFKLRGSETFISQETEGGVHFFFIYQAVLGMQDTLMTYVFSRDQSIVENRAAQVGKYGAYKPKVYELDDTDILPVIDVYRGGCTPLTIQEIARVFPSILEYLPVNGHRFYSTNRLATYLQSETRSLGEVEGQKLKAKIYRHISRPGKYAAEILPEDEIDGINSLGGMRLWETNDLQYAGAHKWKSPLVPPRYGESARRRFHADDYSQLVVLPVNGQPWVVGVVKGCSVSSINVDETLRVTEATDYLFPIPARHENANFVLQAIIAHGLETLVKPEYLQI